MPNTNDFLPFGSNTGANVIAQASYLELASRLLGFSTGVADAQQLNKVWRQGSAVAAMIGQFTADYGGDALDDGDIATLQANFEAALAFIIGENIPSIDTSGLVIRSGDTMTGGFGAPAGFKTAARILSAATTLTSADFGKFIEITASSTVITTIPTPVSNGGARLTVWNNSANAQTLSAAAGAFLGPNASGITTTSIPAGALYCFESDGANWIQASVSTPPGTLPKFSFITTSQTWNRATGATKAWIAGHGAGGAGGGASGTSPTAAGEGGGAGEFRLGLFDISAVSSAAVAIGAGGAGAVNTVGGNGGDTTIGALMTAKGGFGGGTNNSSGSNYALGGSGGSGGEGFPGCGGGSSSAGTGGIGGSGAIGGGGRAGNNSVGNSTGGAGSNGGGGGGADGNAAGGAGGNGFALIIEF